MAGPIALPDAYDGREQAFIKHRLLESYLQTLFLIVGQGIRRSGKSIELCYIDCFAGPWRDDSEGIESTSIAISLRALEACKKKFETNGVSTTVRALYVESDGRAFARLDEFLKEGTPVGVQAQCYKGDFVELRGRILSWVGQEAFAFFFIDPKGWKEVGIETLRPLLQRNRSEFLITFMYDFINRTMSMADWRVEMMELLGEPLAVEGLAPEERERQILATYRESLKNCVPAGKKGYRARTAYARVLDSSKDRPKYHLIYVTSHPLGIVKFMSVSEEVDFVQKQVRAVTKERQLELRSRTPDLFGAASHVDPMAGHAGPDDVDQFWRDYLAKGERRIDVEEFADILERKNWFPGDLQASLLRLMNSGQVVNPDAPKKRWKKPLHFEEPNGERLRLLGIRQ
ncbi:MAG: three-Cys-motif partner protein TcmP [Burkholderiales bacterium]|nr:three-Cys-motif partner protein TcmP [Burkholderiales bacterium]